MTFVLFVFCFKQKTAYEMRISDWSSDVCSSDLNPRSTATGLTHFLAGSWQSEAERPGTFLHSVARGNGWLDDKGGVRGDCRQQLLSLRLDARCSIEAAAAYAKANLTRLTAAGEIGRASCRDRVCQ